MRTEEIGNLESRTHPKSRYNSRHKPGINIFQRDKREERRVAGYKFVASCNTDSKIHLCMTGGTKY